MDGLALFSDPYSDLDLCVIAAQPLSWALRAQLSEDFDRFLQAVPDVPDVPDMPDEPYRP
jgi:hypothetical protein